MLAAEASVLTDDMISDHSNIAEVFHISTMLFTRFILVERGRKVEHMHQLGWRIEGHGGQGSPMDLQI
jgi:hypothetical protein